MSYSLQRAPGGWRAVATCDHAGCTARLERTKPTEAEAAVKLVYALPAEGWSDDDFPRAVYCGAHKGGAREASHVDRLAVVRRGWLHLERLNAALGVVPPDDIARLGDPSDAFANCARALRDAVPRARGPERAELSRVAASLNELAILAKGLSWAEVRGAAGTA